MGWMGDGRWAMVDRCVGLPSNGAGLEFRLDGLMAVGLGLDLAAGDGKRAGGIGLSSIWEGLILYPERAV